MALALGVAACGGHADEIGEYKQQATGTSKRVDRACEEQLELTTGLTVELLAIGETDVDRDRATVRTGLDIDGVEAPRVFVLEQEDRSWKLASGSSG